MLVLLGKTASGKNEVVNKLISRYGFHQIVTYTTRPMRDGEIPDVTYHYINEIDFKERITQGFFAEWRSYTTEFGVWYYGTALEDLTKADDKSIIILTPCGYRSLENKLKEKPIAIYLYANDKTIKARLMARGDDEKEAQRRLKQDNIDFKHFENEADRIVYNDNDNDLDEVIEKIISFLRKKQVEV